MEFSNRGVDEWSRLGCHIVSANTIDTCKKMFDRLMDSEVGLG